jgi:hypothetical protein
MEKPQLELIRDIILTELDRLQDDSLPTCPESMAYIDRLGSALDALNKELLTLP